MHNVCFVTYLLPSYNFPNAITDSATSDRNVLKLARLFSTRVKDQTGGFTLPNSPRRFQRPKVPTVTANSVLRLPIQGKHSNSPTTQLLAKEPLSEPARSLTSSWDESRSKASSSRVECDQSHGNANMQSSKLAVSTTRRDSDTREEHIADTKQPGSNNWKAMECFQNQGSDKDQEPQSLSKTEVDPVCFYENVFNESSPRSSGSDGKTDSFTTEGDPIHFYQNVFNDEDQCKKFPRASSPVKIPESKKRPMPTPRTSFPDDSLKSSSQQVPSPFQSQTSLSMSSIPESSKAESVFQELQNELELIQDVLDCPTIGNEDKKEHQPVTQTISQTGTIKRKTTPKSQKELRRHIVTEVSLSDPEGDDEYILMNSLPLVLGNQSKSTSDLVHLSVEPQKSNGTHSNLRPSSYRTSEYYVTVLPESGPATRGQSSDSEEANMYVPMGQNSDSMVKGDIMESSKEQEKRSHSRNDSAASLDGWKRSQGSIFAQEMIHFMGDFKPKPKRPFRSKTAAELNIPTLSWHEYVDIDFEEDEDKASSQYSSRPQIPPRPSVVPPRLRPKRAKEVRPPSSGSVEYMYAPLAPNNLRIPNVKRSHSHSGGGDSGGGKIAPPIPPPYKPKGTSGGSALAPPILPPKSASMLRENIVLQEQQQWVVQPNPYLTPVNSKTKAKSGKKKYKLQKIFQSKSRKSYQTSQGSPTKPTPADSPVNTKAVIDVLKQQTVCSKSKKNVKTSASPLTPPPLPKVVIASRNRSQTTLTLEEQLEDFSNECTSLDIRQELSRSQSASNILEVPIMPEASFSIGDSTLVSSRSTQQLDEESNSRYLDNPHVQGGFQQRDGPRSRHGTVIVHNKENGKVARRDPINPVGRSINRKSLAIIVKNREVLADYLESQAAGTSSVEELESPTAALSTPRRGKETLVRNLGDLLLEINDLLQSSGSCKDDLIAAIEQELNLKLDHNKSNTNSTSSTKQEVTSNFESGETGASQPFQGPVFEITDRDVQDVVEFVEANSHHMLEIEEREDSSDDEEEYVEYGYGEGPQEADHGFPLSRSHSDALIVDLDSALKDSDSSNSLHSNLCDDGQSLWRDSPRESSEDEKNAEFTRSDFVPNNMKLRRANAKRRPSATADEILSTISSSSNGVGFFTHKGGQLTSQDSSVVIEIPEGAIPQGRSQKLW